MSSITKGNIIRHELIGLPVSIVHSSNPTQVGLKGTIIYETKKMLMILEGSNRKWIQKKGAVYLFTLPDQSIVKVEGMEIFGRPMDRIKKSKKRRS